LTSTIPLFSKSTMRASLTRVPGINQHPRDTRLSRFIDHELPQLPKAPITMLRPLPLMNRDPAPDVGQILQHQNSLRVFGVLDETLGQAMVDPALKPLLLPSHLLQAPFGALGTSGLIGIPRRLSALSRAFDGLTGFRMAVAIGQQVGNTEVNPEKSGRHNRRVFGCVDRRVQVKFPIPVDEIDLSFQSVKPLRLVLPIDELNDLATVQCPQADFIQALPAENPVVIGDGAISTKDRAFRFITLEDFHRLSNGSHRHLCRQTKLLPKRVVAAFVDARLSVDLGLKTDLARIAGCRIKGGHRVVQQRRLFGSREELELQG